MAKAGGAVPSANRISLLRDADGDGRAEFRTVFLAQQRSPFGMALVNDTLYVANTDAVDAFAYNEGATAIAGPGRRVAQLPAGTINHHWTKSLIASRDGSRLYVGVGSNSNVAERGMEHETERAAILEIDRATGAQRVFASGLRNPVGLGFEPQTGALWTAVNERDELGSDLVPDYMTSVKDGGFYGWPYSYFGEHVDARVKPKRPDLVARSIVPDYALGPHTASLGLAFSREGLLPPSMQGGVFVGQHGSWNRKPQSGYKVIFVPFTGGRPAGEPVDVLTGFLDRDGKALGRPVGVALDRQGALLVADDVGNAVWRVRAASGSARLSQAAGTLASMGDTVVKRPPICFRGRPLPRCRAFFLTELSYVRRLAGSVLTYDTPSSGGFDPSPLSIRDFDSHLSWELGYMVNRGAKSALGGTLMIGTGDAGARTAAKGRYRQWIDGGDASIDFSAGLLSAGVRGPTGTTRGVGFTSDVTLGVGDFAGVTARAELMRVNNRNIGALHGGVRLGSLPAVGVSVLGGIGLIVLIAAIARSDF